MAIPLLEVESLSIASAKGVILPKLSFQLFPGEIVAVTGPSGSGKSSLVRAILAILPKGLEVVSGQIRWYGHPEKPITLSEDKTLWASLRGAAIGYIHQDIYGTFDPIQKIGKQMWMLIRERRGSQSTSSEASLRALMQQIGLQDIERIWNSYPHQLSGGQLQRCQIAMAVALQPKLLITDEPTSAIDKMSQLELLDIFAMLRDQYQMSILCITHEPDVVSYLADREIALHTPLSDYQADWKLDAETSRNDQNAVLEVLEICYSHAFGGLMAAKGAETGPFSFSIFPSSTLGIIGASGSGKSTLAQLLVGALIPQTGQMRLEGRPIDFGNQRDIRLLRSKVQLVLQDGRGSLHPYQSVSDILSAAVDKARPASMRQTMVAKVMEDVGLSMALKDSLPSKLSGGECLRVSIARALLMKPGVLICDESTSALDPTTRDGIITLLLKLKEVYGISLVMISHDHTLIRKMADEILVLESGKLVEKGRAEQLLSQPQHALTKKIFEAHATLRIRKGH